MWFFLALLGSMIYAFRGILEKRIIHSINPFVLAFGIRIFALPFFVLPLIIWPDLWVPLDQLPWQFWLSVILLGFVSTPIESYFYYRALKHEELTLTLPILALRPAITMVLVMILLRDFPTFLGIIGVIIIVFGIYSLKIKHVKNGMLEPFRQLTINPAVRMMAIVALFQGISDIFDKVGVVHANAFMYALGNYIFLCIGVGAFMVMYARQHIHQLSNNIRPLTCIGMIVAAYTLLTLIALQDANAAYVSAIKASSVLFSIILGLWLLREKETKTKLFAGIMMVIGLVIIKLFG